MSFVSFIFTGVVNLAMSFSFGIVELYQEVDENKRKAAPEFLGNSWLSSFVLLRGSSMLRGIPLLVVRYVRFKLDF
jgi:hypothetical protein